MTHLTRSLVLGCSVLALAACGADDVVAPGGPIIVNPTPPPAPTPAPVPGGSVTAAASCTAGTADGGTIVLKNSRGTIRNCVIPNNVTGTLTLGGRRAEGIMYSLNGRTEVGTDIDQAGAAATLNILPGVTVFAAVRESSLVVNRGSKLIADGNAGQPIIFTALDNLNSTTITEASDNLWGGIIINGRAPTSDCQVPPGSSTTGGDANCWRASEGIVPRPTFGGNQANDNSGTLRFVQVNFTGVQLGGGDEIQGITLNGIGAGTTMSHIQIHNSRDDGIEAFGGTVNMKNLVLTGNADDSLDTDNGYIGAIQYVLAVRRAAGNTGDSAGSQLLLEVDTSTQPNDATPRQKLKLANFTFIQSTSGEPAIRLRGGADVQLINGIVVDRVSPSNGCLDVDDAATVQAAGAAAQEDGPPVLRSVVFDCNVVFSDAGSDADTFEQQTLSNAANSGVNQTFTNTLQFLTGSTVGNVANGANETGVAAAAGITAISSFFTQVSYIGAFSGPSDTWTQGWTCNSDVADLRGSLACTDIRVL